mgnify:FL=1
MESITILVNTTEDVQGIDNMDCLVLGPVDVNEIFFDKLT